MLVLDERGVGRVRQDQMEAVPGQSRHLVLQGEPALLGAPGRGDHDERQVTKTPHRIGLGKSDRQLCKLVAETAGTVRRGGIDASKFPGLRRQAGGVRERDESSDTQPCQRREQSMAQPKANASRVTPVITCSRAPPKGPSTSAAAAVKLAVSERTTTGPMRSFFMASALQSVGEFHDGGF